MSTAAKKNVLITGTGGRSVGSGILHALLRSSPAVSARWNLIAADADPFAWGLYKTERHVLLPLASDESYLERLNQVAEDLGLDAIIPGTEPETQVLALAQDEVRAPVICNRAELMPLMMDKSQLKPVLSSLGLNYIESRAIQDWREILDSHGYPLVVKPMTGSGGSRGLALITSEREMESFLSLTTDHARYRVQPYVGEGSDEYTVGVLTDSAGKIIDSVVMRRKLVGLSLLDSRRVGDRLCQISTGYSQGFIVKNERIQSFCERLATDLGSRGPLNIQLRVTGDAIQVFEIHPRFSGTTPIRADVGFNEPDILLRNRLFGEKFGRQDYRAGMAAIRAFEHVLVPIEEMGRSV